MWIKEDNQGSFDVTMGNFAGADAREMAGINLN